MYRHAGNLPHGFLVHLHPLIIQHETH
jgi:hypothetical protein